MKTCSRCNQPKPIEEFVVRNDKPSNQCRSCKQEYDRNYHNSRTPEAKKQKQELQEVRKDILRKNLWEYKAEHPCSTCGESDPIVLEFDHKDNVIKEDDICGMVQRGVSWSKILKEIEKCVVLCANCHRRRTYQQFGWYGRI